MALDHSLTYRVHALRNLPHRQRLRDLERTVRGLGLGPGLSYADFGCSNGYITERVRRLTGAAEAWGFDRVEEHLARGREAYPAIAFSRIDLNRPAAPARRFDFVSCFETLEHVGNLETAIGHLIAAIAPEGTALITVPIEIGPRGIVKFLVKMTYGYGLAELPQTPALRRRYARALMTGARMSAFRDQRPGWGTHFGFDYRDVDDALRRHGAPFRAWNSGTTRFYCISQAAAPAGASQLGGRAA